jgi:hypothetical protein
MRYFELSILEMVTGQSIMTTIAIVSNRLYYIMII